MSGLNLLIWYPLKAIPRFWSCDTKRTFTKFESGAWDHQVLISCWAKSVLSLKTVIQHLAFCCLCACSSKFCKPRSNVFACTIGIAELQKNSAQDALEVDILRSKIKKFSVERALPLPRHFPLCGWGLLPPSQTFSLWEWGHPLPTPYPPRRLRHLDTRACGARSLGASSLLEFWLCSVFHRIKAVIRHVFQCVFSPLSPLPSFLWSLFFPFPFSLIFPPFPFATKCPS